MADAEVSPHGSWRRYRYGRCRCQVCRDSQNARQRAYEHRRAAERGTPIDQVDAEPVRQHVQALRRQGLGFKRIARRAGMSESQVRSLVYGRPSIGQAPPRWVRSRTASRLLAVTADEAGDDRG